MTDHRAKRPLRAVAVLAVGLAAAVLPGAAQAQFFGGWGGWDDGGTWDGLAPQQVRRAIADRGFRVLAPLRRNGNVFVADVVDPRGRRERLIVAAADAQILQRFLVDDGRGTGRGAARGPDDERGLVPPADIPDAGRRFARPTDRDAVPQRFGDLGTGGDDGDPGLAPNAPLRRVVPAIRTVKPHARTPDGATATREPGPVESTPLAPAAPRAVVSTPPASPAPAPVAKAPAPPAATPPVVASRPEPAAAPAAPPPAAAAPATASRRLTDPLAIPTGTDAGGKPVRSVASGITGSPAPAAQPSAAQPSAAKPSAAKPGDVPVAPLD